MTPARSNRSTRPGPPDGEVPAERWTLLLTDLVDSTRLTSELGDARSAALMGRHDRMARDVLAQQDGREVDKSDGFLLLFRSPLAAIRFAHAYHAGLRGLSETEGVPLTARAGLHTGLIRLVRATDADIARGAKTWEVEGIAKPTAARIMSLARGGQTLLSAEAATELGDSPADLEVVSHGWYRLKGVLDPIEIFEAAPLGEISEPPADSAKVHRVVYLEEGGWRPAREVPHRLPPERGPSFGRRDELWAVAEAFSAGDRLLTLVGPGGTGKTHLALRYARAWLGEWPGGAWFCDLSEVRNIPGFVRALGEVLFVPLDQGDPLITLGEALRHRGELLVIIDNVEQLIEDLGPPLDNLRRAAPNAAFLLTSRQRLGLPGERVLPIEPLPAPEPGTSPADLLHNAAVALFVARARAVLPSFQPEGSTLLDIVEVVRLLDGLPLALELAAARVRVLSPKGILERMGRRFDLLREQRGVRGGRQSTLRGALDWSWELLSEPERGALARCAVFEGTFSLEAAEATLDPSDLPGSPWALDLLESLVDKSLVRSVPRPDGEVRFGLFRSIQDYAREKLDERGELATTAARHAEHFAQWGEPTKIAALHRADGAETRDRLALEFDNLVAAARWAAAAGESELAAGVTLGALACLESSGPFALAEELGLLALLADPPFKLKVRLGVALSGICVRAGEPDRAIELIEEIRLAGTLDRSAAAWLALTEGQAQLLRREGQAATKAFEQALGLMRATGDRRGEGLTLAELAHVVGVRGGRIAEAKPLLDRALLLLRAQGDFAGEALAESYRGALCCIVGDFVAGRTAYERSRVRALEARDRRTAGIATGMLAGICVVTGELDAAWGFFEDALSTQRSIGDRVHEAMHCANYAELLARTGRLDDAIANLSRAAEIAGLSGDAMTEGLALGNRGPLRAQQGDVLGAQADMERGEQRLRAAGDPAELGKHLCRSATLWLQCGEPERARTALAEVEAIVSQIPVTAASEVSVALAELRRALAQP